jgi:hypothetical protein
LIPSPLNQIVWPGLLSTFLYLWITFLSFEFVYGEGHRDRPILLVLVLFLVLFSIQVYVIRAVRKIGRDRNALIGIFLFAATFRLVLLLSNLIQEDDVYRYLWEGRVSAEGINPYRYSAWQVEQYRHGVEIEKSPWTDEDRNNLDRLVRVSGPETKFSLILDRVNHPHVSTIYPPLSQFLFWLAALAVPGSIAGFKLWIMALDGVTLWLLYRLLRSLGWNPLYLVVYAWSPLVLKEFGNTGHVDALAVTLVLSASVTALRGRTIGSLFFLALATASKFYPFILLPLFLHRIKGEGAGSLCKGLGVYIGTLAVLYLPFLGAGERLFHGLFRYAADWEMNDFLFSLIKSAYSSIPLEGLRSTLTVSFWTFQFENPWYEVLTKGTAFGIVGLAVLYCLFRRDPKEPREFLFSLFIVLGAVFLTSPVQNPWYLTWLMPFLVLFRFPSWLLLSGLIFGYYLRFYLFYHHLEEWWRWVVYGEFVPFYILLIREYWLVRKKRYAVFDPGK